MVKKVLKIDDKSTIFAIHAYYINGESRSKKFEPKILGGS